MFPFDDVIMMQDSILPVVHEQSDLFYWYRIWGYGMESEQIPKFSVKSTFLSIPNFHSL